MTSLAQYDRWKADRAAASIGQVNVILGDAVQSQPDQVASDIKLGKAFGIPATLAAEGRDTFTSKLEARKSETVLRSSPMLTEWLRNPENARTSWDDLENLSWFEGMAAGVRNTGARAVARTQQMGAQYMLEQTAGRAQDRSLSFGEILDSERDTIRTSTGDEKAWVNLSDMIAATGRYVDARYADLIGTDDEASATEYAASLKAALDAQSAAPKPLIAQNWEKEAFDQIEEGETNSTLGEALASFATATLKNPMGAMSWALATAGENAPQLAAALGITVATRNPNLGVLSMGGGSYATERYVAPAEFLQEKGIDLSRPEDVQRIVTEPELLNEAAERGVVRGLVIGLFDVVSGGLAGRTLAGNPVVEAIAQSTQQAISGATGEYVARVAAGQEIDWNEVLAEGIAEIATAPVDMGIAGHRLYRDRSAAKAAERERQQIDQIAENATASKLRQRLDSNFMDFVDRAADGSPVENVYVPAEKMQEYFQSGGVDPDDFISEVPGMSRADFDTALSTGGDVKIPTGAYAAKIAGTEFDPFLRENMRFDPEGMTWTEAQEFNARADEAVQRFAGVEERL